MTDRRGAKAVMRALSSHVNDILHENGYSDLAVFVGVLCRLAESKPELLHPDFLQRLRPEFLDLLNKHERRLEACQSAEHAMIEREEIGATMH